MTGTIKRGKLNRADLAHWDGRTATASRVDATGGTVTGLAFGNRVDVLQVYGSGTSRTVGTISAALQTIGSTKVTLEFAPGTWDISESISIPATITCVVPNGCVFDVASGKTLTFLGRLHIEYPALWTSGSGTVSTVGKPAGAAILPTSAEVAASVSITYHNYEPGDFRRYGAAGDGTTDDGTAVRAAILQSLQSGGSIPFGQPGATYLCTTWTAIDSTSAIRLGGRGYTLKGPVSRVDFARPGGTVEADGVTFNRWQSVMEREDADTGSVTLNMDRFRFEDVTSIALNVERPIANFRLTHGTVENTDGGYAVRVGQNVYADQDDWNDGLLFAVDFADIDGSSTSSTAASILYGKRSSIIGCTVDGVAQAGTGEAWGFYTKLRWGTVAFNKIANVDAAGSSDVTGITMKGDTRGSTTSPQGYGSLVFGNVLAFIGSTSGTQRGSGIRSQCDECYAAFNVVEDAYLNGVVFDEPDGDNSGSFFNRIRFTTASGTFGIRMSQGGSGLRSFGDEITNAETGVRLSAGAGSVDADAMVVAHDVINATVDAIQVNTSGAGDIDGLHIINNVVPSATTGLRFSGGTVTNFRALDNDFRGATTQFAGTIPADCEIRHTFRGQTTDASATDLISLTLSDDAAYRVRIEVVAVQSGGGNRNDYHRSALVYRDGGNATLQGSVIDIETPRESAAGWDCTIAVTGSTVVVRATGALATSINWKVHLHIIGTD